LVSTSKWSIGSSLRDLDFDMAWPIADWLREFETTLSACSKVRSSATLLSWSRGCDGDDLRRQSDLLSFVVARRTLYCSGWPWLTDPWSKYACSSSDERVVVLLLKFGSGVCWIGEGIEGSVDKRNQWCGKAPVFVLRSSRGTEGRTGDWAET
jgi:hypothetical protein